MEATYHLKPGELTDDFLKAMQLLFQHQRVKVTIEVEEADEMEAIRTNPALYEKLLRRLQNVEAGQVQEVNIDEYVNDASANI